MSLVNYKQFKSKVESLGYVQHDDFSWVFDKGSLMVVWFGIRGHFGMRSKCETYMLHSNSQEGTLIITETHPKYREAELSLQEYIYSMAFKRSIEEIRGE